MTYFPNGVPHGSRLLRRFIDIARVQSDPCCILVGRDNEHDLWTPLLYAGNPLTYSDHAYADADMQLLRAEYDKLSIGNIQSGELSYAEQCRDRAMTAIGETLDAAECHVLEKINEATEKQNFSVNIDIEWSPSIVSSLCTALREKHGFHVEVCGRERDGLYVSW